jgi:PAS domain S-box-containing protein
MNEKERMDSRPPQADKLRREAEQRLVDGKITSVEAMTDLEVRALFHELQVHQVELEIQNEELLRAQTEIKEISDKYQDLFDFSPVGYLLMDERGRILEINVAGAALIGLDRIAALQKGFGQFVAEEYGSEFADFCRRIPASDCKQTCVIELLCNEQRVYALLEGLPSSGSDRSCPFRVTITNITERKLAEEDTIKLQAQLQQAQKMESVGRLAGGVAHDFNNMLSVILGHADMALNEMDPTLPLYDDLREIKEAAKRSANLTRQLLAFARKQTIAPKMLDLNTTIVEMLKMLQRLIGEGIHLIWQPGPNLWQIKMDPSQIDQILVNLCVNARDAMASVGKVTIETGNRILDENCAAHLGFAPGEYVSLMVSDNGCGMDKETLSCIFEPFFTTKGIGTGTGLGLSTVYGIVKQNNGFINVNSEQGHGTAFTIYLPRHMSPEGQAVQGGAAVEPTLRGHETLLLVEDEPAILKLTKLMLERQGYTVLAASSPGEAIRMAEAYLGEIHLLMTDVIMPGMNGWDTAKSLLTLFPYLKCLFTSGYTADIIAQNGVLDEGTHFIQKPFSMNDLTVKLRQVLDG